MRLLAVDSSTEACSAALWLDGAVTERYRIAPREHTDLLLPMVDELLAEAQLALSALDGIAFGRGPGSFTGVRIGTGVAQGLAFAADLPAVPVSTLEALAVGCGRPQVLAAIDARMGEIYWGAYRVADDGAATAAAPECVVAPGAVAVPGNGLWFGCGTGWATYSETLRGCIGSALEGWDGDRYPRAGDIAAIGARRLAAGEGVPAEAALPVYLRDRVTHQRARA